MKHICNYCKKEFDSEYLLKKHTNKTIYCKKIKLIVDHNIEQEQKLINEINNYKNEINDYKDEVDICNQTIRKLKLDKDNMILDYKYNIAEFEKQIKKLKENIEEYKNEISEYKDEISEYQNEISKYKLEISNLEKEFEINCLKKDLNCSNKITDIVTGNSDKMANILTEFAKHPTKINNNNSNKVISNTFVRENCKPITDEFIAEKAKYISLDYINKLEEGIALYMIDHIFKETGIVLDNPKLKLYKWIDSNNNIVEDIKAKLITNKVVNSTYNNIVDIAMMDLDEATDTYNNERHVIEHETESKLENEGYSWDEIVERLSKIRDNKPRDVFLGTQDKWTNLLRRLNKSRNSSDTEVYKKISDTLSLHVKIKPSS